METLVSKKKPGRPKKNTFNSSEPIEGVVSVPANANNIIEMIYFGSTCFKKILSLYKSYTCSSISIFFRETSIVWFAQDHQEKADIYTDIDCRYIKRYFCAKPINVMIDREDLEVVLDFINKSIESVAIIIQNSEARSQIIFQLRNNESNITEKYEIKMTEIDSSFVLTRPNCEDYPIAIRINSKEFKDRIGIANKKRMKTISFQKYKKEPFQISCSNDNVIWAGVFNDTDKLFLRNRLGEEEVFVVTLGTDLIYDYANNSPGTYTTIVADRHKKFAMMAILEERDQGLPTISVSVFIEVTNYS